MMKMKVIIFFLILFAGKVFSEENNNKDVRPTLASIWKVTSSTSIIFVRFGSIISDKHILIESTTINKPQNGDIITDRTVLDGIGVAYGLSDATKVNIGIIDHPKKMFFNPYRDIMYIALLEMDKIGCNTRLVCVPSFFDFNDKKSIIGSYFESGEIKNFDVSMTEKSRCNENNAHYKITDEGKELCIIRKTDTISSATPLQWFNPQNKIWYLVGVQWDVKNPYAVIGAYNISFLKPWIQKTVEDGSLNALLSPC